MIGWQLFSATRGTIRLNSNGQEPRLKLPRGCFFHAFVRLKTRPFTPPTHS
jgi:hypothetical protein